MTIYFHKKGFTRNSEIGNSYVWDLPNIWRLGQVRNTEFGTNVYNKILLNAVKYQSYNSFYRFWVIKEKPTGRRSKITPFSTEIRVKKNQFCRNLFWYYFWCYSACFYKKSFLSTSGSLKEKVLNIYILLCIIILWQNVPKF